MESSPGGAGSRSVAPATGRGRTRGRAGPRTPGPQAARKWLTASVAADAVGVIAAVFAEAGRRDPGRQRTWIALAAFTPDDPVLAWRA